MGTAKIEIPREALADFCRRHHIRKLSLFGSVLRDDFRPDSDVDVLVEFEPGEAPDFFEYVGMELECPASIRFEFWRQLDLRVVPSRYVWSGREAEGRSAWGFGLPPSNRIS
jgi:predicted nucleotidyltransferase